MIQFNLLPDVKLEFIKATYRKRLIIAVSSIFGGVTLLTFAMLFLYVKVNQPKYMGDLDKDINKNVSSLQAKQDLNKILTVQNQLNSLPGLHDQKVIGSRFVDYLVQLTPAEATISDVDINFEEKKMTIEGNAATLSTVNKFIDTLKFTRYQVHKEKKDGDKEEDLKKACTILSDDKTACRAFSSIVLESYEIEDQTDLVKKNGGPIAYEIVLNFEPTIFSNVKDAAKGELPITLSIPKAISTRSVLETPGNELFAPQADQQKNQGTR